MLSKKQTVKILLWPVAVFAALFLGRYLLPGKSISISVGEGWSAGQVAAELKNNRVIGSKTLFKLAYRLFHGRRTIAAGKYSLKTRMPAESALRVLLRPPEKTYRRLVIPEGWRMEQVAERLDALHIARGDEFLRLAKSRGAEGYLFPSTYFFEDNTPPETVLSVMRRQFDKQVAPLLKAANNRSLSEKELLTIASIVEREAVMDSERPLIAAVYLNRVKLGMALEADPTVQYALGWNEKERSWWEKGLSLKDLKYDSSYNTYRYRGIPPGPICSASVNSIKAVLAPAETNALYFVADRTGYHIFNSKFSEHLKAKASVEAREKARNRQSR